MPNIELKKSVLERLAKRKITKDDLELVKGSIEEEKGDDTKIEIADTNRPDLWSVEGIARCFREKGVPKLELSKSKGKEKIIVDSKIKTIRPFIAGVVANKLKVTEELLIDLIQLQEKLSENFGKKREKISVGIYNYDDITFPVFYKAVKPEDAKFIPLEFEKPMSLKEIIEKHPKGMEYGYIIKHHDLYPLFIDSKEEVLSFPPIINSNFLGKIKPGIANVFVEITGVDLKHVLLVTNIIAYALHDRGAELQAVDVIYPWKTELGDKITTPYIFGEKVSFNKSMIEKMLGINLKDSEIKKYLETMQYDATIAGNKVTVVIPPYRNDIMHAADVIEDILIAYGYNRLEPNHTLASTTGKDLEITEFERRAKRLLIGLGFQEIMSFILSNKKNIETNMNTTLDTLEIANPMSMNYSAVRSWILPNLLECLSKNLHVEYPQHIFELGECIEKSETLSRAAACLSDTKAAYENITSKLDAFLRNLGIEYRLSKATHPSFITGRCASVFVNGNQIGVVGEVHPQVLQNWGLENPVAAFEVGITKLFEMKK